MKEGWSKAFEIIQGGGIVIIPTDTVFGLVCRIDKPLAIKRLYQIKERMVGNPTLILVRDYQMAARYGTFERKADILAKRFWPGPVTLVVPARETVPNLIRGADKSVGIRVPKFASLLQLLEELNVALVAPSANFKDAEPPKRFAEIDKNLANLVDYVVEDSCGGKTPSTMVKMSDGKYHIIRQGPISIEEIEGALKGVLE